MSTECEIQIYLDTISKIKADKCASDILQCVKKLESKYNYFDSSSLLSDINSRKIETIDTQTKDILSRAKKYYTLTNQIFDITTATIKDIYKLTSLDQMEKEKKRLSQYIGCEHFKISKNKIYFDNIFTKIDFGGFVKEYAVDCAVNILKKYKIKSALINFGGDIYALGLKPNNEKFTVAIKNPLNTDENILHIPIQNQALTTSASYERFDTIENSDFSHIIDTKNRTQDKINNILSATVISNNCVQSGIYSTSLMIDSTLIHNNTQYLINDKLEIQR